MTTFTTSKLTQATSRFTKKHQVGTLYLVLHGVKGVLPRSSHWDVSLISLIKNLIRCQTQVTRKFNVQLVKVHYFNYYLWILFILFTCGSLDFSIAKNSIQSFHKPKSHAILSCVWTPISLEKVLYYLGTCPTITQPNINGRTDVTTDTVGWQTHTWSNINMDE